MPTQNKLLQERQLRPGNYCTVR